MLLLNVHRVCRAATSTSYSSVYHEGGSCACGHEPDTPGFPSPCPTDPRTTLNQPKDPRARVLLEENPQDSPLASPQPGSSPVPLAASPPPTASPHPGKHCPCRPSHHRPAALPSPPRMLTDDEGNRGDPNSQTLNSITLH
jgi:hypothetical protein